KAILPGEAYEEALCLLGYGLFFLGGLSGAGLAFSLLTYTGTAPLNVSVYLGMTVFLQILLLLLLGGLLIIRMIRPQLFYSSMIYSLLSRLVIYLSRKFKPQVTRSISGSRREHLSAILGLVRGKKQIYGSLFYWPVFILAQLFGIGFNLGILGATLLRVLGTDMAFGWQSTLQVSATAVHAIVKWMAVPWSWMVSPDLAYPSLARIEGSRLILKDGIYHLSTPDLVAWWPFLCFAVLFYGLLPRLLLYFFGRATQRYLLGKINFTQSACDQLFDRMTTPQVVFGDRSGSSVESRTAAISAVLPETGHTGTENPGGEKKFILLVPDDIFDDCPDPDLEQIMAHTLGGRIVKKIRTGCTDTGDTFSPALVIPPRNKNDWTHLLILQEAWQPPIVEDVAIIKALRQHLGDHTPIIVGLIGKPEPDTIFTPVTPTNWRTWQERLASLGDPYLRLERLVHENT
ncbi:MAG: hypothetical protein DSY90_12010, partial [Deltaproteobacteria bacterium]